MTKDKLVIITAGRQRTTIGNPQRERTDKRSGKGIKSGSTAKNPYARQREEITKNIKIIADYRRKEPKTQYGYNKALSAVKFINAVYDRADDKARAGIFSAGYLPPNEIDIPYYEMADARRKGKPSKQELELKDIQKELEQAQQEKETADKPLPVPPPRKKPPVKPSDIPPAIPKPPPPPAETLEERIQRLLKEKADTEAKDRAKKLSEIMKKQSDVVLNMDLTSAPLPEGYKRPRFFTIHTSDNPEVDKVKPKKIKQVINA